MCTIKAFETFVLWLIFSNIIYLWDLGSKNKPKESIPQKSKFIKPTYLFIHFKVKFKVSTCLGKAKLHTIPTSILNWLANIATPGAAGKTP